MSAQIIPNLPFEDYLSRPALSISRLKMLAKAPALINFAKEETAAMRMGSLVHCAVLEPGELDFRYAAVDLGRTGTNVWDACQSAAWLGDGFLEKLVPLNGSPSSKAWKDAKEQGLIPILNGDYEQVKWIAREQPEGGRELVKQADYDAALRMRDAVWAHPVARELLEGCETEVSAFWTDPETGLACKARADAVNSRMGVPVDIKTCCDAGPREFARNAAKLGYHLQDDHYREGFGFDDFVFVAVEKETLLVACYEFDKAARDAARARRRSLMAQYAECAAANYWPGYETGITTITLPAWALSEE
jgi:hypothetical protein